MPVSQSSFYLPDTLRIWPWKRAISPHYQAAKAESVAWIESFAPFSPEAQVAFNKCNFSLLAACTYTRSNFYNFRSCCDLMHTFFVLDEYTDKMDGATTRILCEASMDAILHPEKPRPEGENIIGEISRQFWERASRGAPFPAQERFIATWRRYLDSVILQSERRTNAYICTVDEYLAARRDNIGSDPSMALLEICLEVDIPHEIMEHPALAAVTEYTAYLNTLGNDLCSYKREFLSGDADYNAVTVAMTQISTDLTGAVQWVSDLHDEIVDKFLKTRADVIAHRNGVPSWGVEMDSAVCAYIDGLGSLVLDQFSVSRNHSPRMMAVASDYMEELTDDVFKPCHLGQWVRGSDEWNYGSGRYFGDEGAMIQKTRKVVIG